MKITSPVDLHVVQFKLPGMSCGARSVKVTHLLSMTLEESEPNDCNTAKTKEMP